ncbi:MAG: hypothetical protein V1844_22795 [Pseudomonadota bacterium]
MKVENPFFWMTKADIIKKLKDNGGGALLNSTVSCSRTFDKGIKAFSMAKRGVLRNTNGEGQIPLALLR